ncbi:MAG TPA: hypothetical protein DEF68_09505 [Elusimicrobia bacterium]|nr:hypothetical protein [Elusimicrobiota bacterium]
MLMRSTPLNRVSEFPNITASTVIVDAPNIADVITVTPDKPALPADVRDTTSLDLAPLCT